MIEKKQGKLNANVLSPLFSSLNLIETETEVVICRDPDDDKFIECAIDAKALYIVSGDNDLLTIKEYEGIQIITAKDFCVCEKSL
jgi:putative PIN family toxin of toxin-antitoxin system